MIKEYFSYLINSHNLHGVHSPFVFEFNEKVLNIRPEKEALKEVNAYRNFLRGNVQKLIVDDYGSGSQKLKSRERSVNEIYKTASTNTRMGEILYQLIRFYDCRNILEIGTCLGIGTAYMQKAVSEFTDAKITTLEGSHSLLEFTKNNLKDFTDISKVNFIEGNFDDTLPEILSHIPRIDLAFVDGNHTYAATLNYFNLLKNKIHNESIIIFDDIYWNTDMKKAWTEIKLHPTVSCSIDLFRWGIIFFRKEMEKEDFTLRFNGFLQAHIG